MGKTPRAREAALRLYPVHRFRHLRFIEVEGELGEPSSKRWSALLHGALEKQVEGIAVDLRGCRAIDDDRLGALLATGAALKARGGSGVVLVMVPGSPLGRQIGLRVGDELPMCDSGRAAMLALGDRRMPVPEVLRLELDGEVAMIVVNGEFDLARGDDSRAVLDEALALEEPLMVDLEHCDFIDSTGIALLIHSSQVAEHGFAMAASGPQVHRVLDLVGIPELLPTFDTRRDALRALASQSAP